MLSSHKILESCSGSSHLIIACFFFRSKNNFSTILISSPSWISFLLLWKHRQQIQRKVWILVQRPTSSQSHHVLTKELPSISSHLGLSTIGSNFSTVPHLLPHQPLLKNGWNSFPINGHKMQPKKLLPILGFVAVRENQFNLPRLSGIQVHPRVFTRND